MVISVQITDVEWSKSCYLPGESAQFTVHLTSQVGSPLSVRLEARISSLGQQEADLVQMIALSGGDQAFAFSWQPPMDSPRGYGVDLVLTTQSGGILATASTAFDVLARWTQMPRYGFLTDFAPGRTDAVETMDGLVRFHLNALQFYDWMYRHDQYLTDQDPYQDPLGRVLSRSTIDALIAAAHEHGIAAMPYTAVYAASLDFFHQHQDWAMDGSDGKPLFFGTNFLVYMDPRPASPWTAYLLNQFDQILEKTGFDGIHLDQYGDPKVGYDAQGHSYPLDTVLAEFINATHSHVHALRPQGAVVFNAVTNWPIQTVAPSAEDIVYIEVWPPYTGYTDLEQLILQGQILGNGKPVVLAAYIDPLLEHNARLIDAVIFASGGGHIELGEKNGMLSEAYFPRYGTMSAELAAVLQRDYDFAVRYQNVTGPETQSNSPASQPQVEVDGVSTDVSQGSGMVLPILRSSEGYLAVNLVNLLGVPSPEWQQPLATDPTPLGQTQVSISPVTRRVAQVWVASPDWADASLRTLPFKQADGALSFEIPSLAYWDMILIQWED
jgi:dextranase